MSWKFQDELISSLDGIKTHSNWIWNWTHIEIGLWDIFCDHVLARWRKNSFLEGIFWNFWCFNTFNSLFECGAFRVLQLSSCRLTKWLHSFFRYTRKELIGFSSETKKSTRTQRAMWITTALYKYIKCSSKLCTRFVRSLAFADTRCCYSARMVQWLRTTYSNQSIFPVSGIRPLLDPQRGCTWVFPNISNKHPILVHQMKTKPSISGCFWEHAHQLSIFYLFFHGVFLLLRSCSLATWRLESWAKENGRVSGTIAEMYDRGRTTLWFFS